jgi:hypothetical protein
MFGPTENRIVLIRLCVAFEGHKRYPLYLMAIEIAIAKQKCTFFFY